MRRVRLGPSIAVVLALAGGCGGAPSAEPHLIASSRETRPLCDPRECGPAPDIELLVCRATGLPTGLTGRCVRASESECAWEIAPCDTGSILTKPE